MAQIAMTKISINLWLRHRFQSIFGGSKLAVIRSKNPIVVFQANRKRYDATIVRQPPRPLVTSDNAALQCPVNFIAMKIKREQCTLEAGRSDRASAITSAVSPNGSPKLQKKKTTKQSGYNILGLPVQSRDGCIFSDLSQVKLE